MDFLDLKSIKSIIHANFVDLTSSFRNVHWILILIMNNSQQTPSAIVSEKNCVPFSTEFSSGRC